MFNFIKKFFSKNVVKRDILLTELEYVVDTIEGITLPNLDLLLKPDNLKELEDNNDIKDIVSKFKEFTGDRSITSIRSMLEGLVSYHQNILDEVPTIEKNIKGMEKYISDEDMNAREYATVNIVDELMSSVLFTSDLFLYILYTGNVDKENSFMTTAKIEAIVKGIRQFGSIYRLTVKDEFKKRVDGISKLSDVSISDPDVKLNASKNDLSYKLPVSDFLYSPIYHIRLWLLEIDMERIRTLEDKKRLLESKILELKLKDDKDLKKSIEYFEEELGKTESKIRKLSEV